MLSPLKMATIHIFRNDLRINDNIALNSAEKVIPVFIFDPKQLENSPYAS